MELNKLRELREQNKLKQEDIANLLNISRATYTSYEIGRDTIPLDKLNMFANHFNVSIDYLLNLSTILQYEKSKKDIDIKITAKRLKETRKEHKLTQEKLAQILNTTHSVWCRYEQAKYLINTSFLYGYSKYLNLSADYLLGKIDYPKYFKN